MRKAIGGCGDLASGVRWWCWSPVEQTTEGSVRSSDRHYSTGKAIGLSRSNKGLRLQPYPPKPRKSSTVSHKRPAQLNEV
jgi:hypothetical protein